MSKENLRHTIMRGILDRLSPQGERREEALAEVFNLTVPGMEKAAAANLAALVPVLPDSLYERWAGMFADRLLETVPFEQIRDLCKPDEESRGTLALVYLMFMESERMEKQVTEDLKTLAVEQGDPGGAALAVSAWLRRRMTGQAREQ